MHAIGFGEGLGDDRFGGAERLQHVHVLRALAGIEERDLRRRTVSAEDALRAQRLPHGRLVGCQRLERLGGLCPPDRRHRHSRWRGVPARADPLPQARPAPARGPLRRLSVPRADARPVRPPRRRRSPARLATAPCTELRCALPAAADRCTGDVRTACRCRSSCAGMYSSSTAWKLVPPKPKALTPARRTPSAGAVQGFNSVLTYSGEWAKSISGLGCSQWTLGGSTLSRSARVAFKQSGGARGALQMPDVRFDRAQRHRRRPEAEAAEHVHHALRLRPRRPRGWRCRGLRSRSRWRATDRHSARRARSHSFWPTGLGAVMPFPLPSLDPPMPRSTA